MVEPAPVAETAKLSKADFVFEGLGSLVDTYRKGYVHGDDSCASSLAIFCHNFTHSPAMACMHRGFS
jgi:hypothetical protein